LLFIEIANGRIPTALPCQMTNPGLALLTIARGLEPNERGSIAKLAAQLRCIEAGVPLSVRRNSSQLEVVAQAFRVFDYFPGRRDHPNSPLTISVHTEAFEEHASCIHIRSYI